MRLSVSLRALAVFAGAAAILAAPLPSLAKSEKPAPTLSGAYLAGHVAQKRRDLPSAAKYLNAALKLDPNAPDMMRLAFQYSVMDGRLDEAVALAKKLIAVSPKTPVATLALAVDDARKGKWDAVETRLAALDQNGLNAYTAPLLRAWAAQGKGDKELALKLLKPLANVGGTQALHDTHAGLISMVAGDKASAEKYLAGVAKEKGGVTFRGARLLGNLYEQQGKSAEAKAAYDLFRDLQPNTRLLDSDLERMDQKGTPPVLIKDAKDGMAEALYGVSAALNQDGGYEMSLILGRLALALRPDFPIMSYTLGSILEALDRPEDAIKAYRAIGAKTAFHRRAQLRVAANLDEIGKTEEAISILKGIAKANPKDAGPWVSLGDLYRRKQKWPESVAAYDDAMKRLGTLDASQWQLLYTRGIALERNKQWDRAEKDFLKALELEPDQPLVLNYLGYSWIEQRVHLDRALEMIKTAVRKRPRDGYITDSLGWAYYQLGQFDKAVPELERAVELRPEDPVINDHLGDAYWRVGRKLEATFQWNHSLSLKPEEGVRKKVEEKLKNGLVIEADSGAKKPNGG